jgi:hypothetical protein
MKHVTFAAIIITTLFTGCGKQADKAGKVPADRAAWRQLRQDMTEDQVRSILGEPLRVERYERIVYWLYQDGEIRDRKMPRGCVQFKREETLTSWADGIDFNQLRPPGGPGRIVGNGSGPDKGSSSPPEKAKPLLYKVVQWREP